MDYITLRDAHGIVHVYTLTTDPTVNRLITSSFWTNLNEEPSCNRDFFARAGNFKYITCIACLAMATGRRHHVRIKEPGF